MLSRIMNNKWIATIAGVGCLLIICSIWQSAASAEYSGECWVINGGSGQIAKLTAKGELTNVIISGFSQPQMAIVNPRDGSCWVSDAAGGVVFRFNSDGSLPEGFPQTGVKFKGKRKPRSISIDPNDGSAWVGTDISIAKISAIGQMTPIPSTGVKEVYVAVNTADGSCWAADSSGKVLKYSKAGQRLLTAAVQLKEPKYIAVNPKTGEAWVADTQAGIVVKLDANGKEILRVTEVGMPTSPSVNPVDGSCWVASANTGQVFQLSANGKVAKKIPLPSDFGFSMPSSLVVNPNPKDNSIWIADQMGGQIIKLSNKGKIILRIPGFDQPASVSAGYWAGQ